MIGYYLVNNSHIITMVGKDLNGNGRLDWGTNPPEIIAVTGEWVFSNAINDNGFRKNAPGQMEYFWRNTKIKGIDPVTGEIIADYFVNDRLYVYNTVTGILTVYIWVNGQLMIDDNEGNLVPQEPQPAPNDPQPTPTWTGAPKNFPGWILGVQGFPPTPEGRDSSN